MLPVWVICPVKRAPTCLLPTRVTEPTSPALGGTCSSLRPLPEAGWRVWAPAHICLLQGRLRHWAFLHLVTSRVTGPGNVCHSVWIGFLSVPEGRWQ